jgi:putative PIN family toxin of toxin-antitoxin system
VRLVLDTNVVLSALLWRGLPYRLLETIRQRPNLQICSSAFLIQELADVLTRPSASKRLALIDKSAGAVLADFVEVVEWVEPAGVLRVVPNDPDDDHVLAAALFAHADLIVSGDSDLLTLASYQNIPILTVAQAVERLGG